MVSRRKILSRSRDELHSEMFAHEEEDDVWLTKDQLYQVSIESCQFWWFSGSKWTSCCWNLQLSSQKNGSFSFFLPAECLHPFSGLPSWQVSPKRSTVILFCFVLHLMKLIQTWQLGNVLKLDDLSYRQQLMWQLWSVKITFAFRFVSLTPFWSLTWTCLSRSGLVSSQLSPALST